VGESVERTGHSLTSLTTGVCVCVRERERERERESAGGFIEGMPSIFCNPSPEMGVPGAETGITFQKA